MVRNMAGAVLLAIGALVVLGVLTCSYEADTQSGFSGKLAILISGGLVEYSTSLITWHGIIPLTATPFPECFSQGFPGGCDAELFPS